MKKILAITLCTAVSVAICGCDKPKVDDISTEIPTIKATSITSQAGDYDYNIIEEYSRYFNNNKVSTENITLTKVVADEHCESYYERGMKSAFYETIEDVKNNFGIDYLRHSSEASTGFDYVYSIHPAKDEQNNIWYLIYIYNKKGEVIDSFCIDKILKTYDFSENLKVDKSTLEDVLKIDINTQPVQTSDGLYESIHRCFGYGISVNVYIIYKKVNNTFIVSDIEYVTDPVRFVENMTLVDYQLFQEWYQLKNYTHAPKKNHSLIVILKTFWFSKCQL